jgi:hypothetical protein
MAAPACASVWGVLLDLTARHTHLQCLIIQCVATQNTGMVVNTHNVSAPPNMWKGNRYTNVIPKAKKAQT